mmetsp:Transcript_14095/g.16346  ORF Transcript_14095/g.16346 Transcript_14095/m.16346 type:complete len:113 (-) Transcript_14095:120-458(-)
MSRFKRNTENVPRSEHNKLKKFVFPIMNRSKISTISPASMTSHASLLDDRKKIDIILKSSKQSIILIKNLVNDLLDYAKLENASFKLFPAYFNFQQMIDKGIAMMFWQAKEK